MPRDDSSLDFSWPHKLQAFSLRAPPSSLFHHSQFPEDFKSWSVIVSSREFLPLEGPPCERLRESFHKVQKGLVLLHPRRGKARCLRQESFLKRPLFSAFCEELEAARFCILFDIRSHRLVPCL